MLVTEDEARTTFELEDRYVIEPSLGFWSRDTYEKLDTIPVTEGFQYKSDSNDEWLTPDILAVLLSDGSL